MFSCMQFFNKFLLKFFAVRPENYIDDYKGFCSLIKGVIDSNLYPRNLPPHVVLFFSIVNRKWPLHPFHPFFGAMPKRVLSSIRWLWWCNKISIWLRVISICTIILVDGMLLLMESPDFMSALAMRTDTLIQWTGTEPLVALLYFEETLELITVLPVMLLWNWRLSSLILLLVHITRW